MTARLLGLVTLIVAVVAGGAGYVFLQQPEGRRVLVLNSYHQGYPWSDEITQELRRALESRGVTLQVHYMGMMYVKTPETAAQAAGSAKSAVEAFAPDLLVTIDDPAVEHVIVPHYRGGELPVVFAGLGSNAEKHGLPAGNVTGMVEKGSLFALLDVLRQFSGGATVGALAGDTPETRRTLDRYQRQLGVPFQAVELVTGFREWKQAYRQLQDEVDVLYVHDNVGIPDWNAAEAVRFANENAVVPSGSINTWMAPVVLFVFGRDPGEHGSWAAETAMSILEGQSPDSIQIIESSRTPTLVNSRMARSLLVDVPVQLIEGATDVQ